MTLKCCQPAIINVILSSFKSWLDADYFIIIIKGHFLPKHRPKSTGWVTLWTVNTDVVSITFNNPKSTCVWLRPQKRFAATNRRTSKKKMRSFWYWWVNSDSQFHQFSGKELEFRPYRWMLILWFWFFNEGPVGLTADYFMHITSDSTINLCSYSDQWCWDNNLFLHVTSRAATIAIYFYLFPEQQHWDRSLFSRVLPAQNNQFTI